MPVNVRVDPSAASCEEWVRRFAEVRRFSLRLIEPLSAEDCAAQSMPDASPAKWHLAHTTWFFETFILQPFVRDYPPFSEQFCYLFNSYYNAVGDRHPRPRRGLLTRPTFEEMLCYRHHVDEHLIGLLGSCPAERRDEIAPLLEIGLHHEQQHQELLLTDLKHLFSRNPLYPAYRPAGERPPSSPSGMGWVGFGEGVRWIGHGGDGFAYDNESPRHRVFVEAFELADRLVTNGEYLAFIEDGGYRRPELWLDAGWAAAGEQGWEAPLYWMREGDGDGDEDEWSQFTLGGVRGIDPAEPVCHVSFFEADAFARWYGARLATEAEWETACGDGSIARTIEGNFVESGPLHPAAAPPAPPAMEGGVRQAFGDAWEWTRSQYDPYPGYRPPDGALGEYNGKFMCNQFVLRGGSCATSRTHIRPTYRNFFPPAARWQFTGIRLARDID